MKRYFAFVDPSGGSSDSMTLAVAHADGEKVILDGVWEKKPPFSPAAVVEEFAATVKRYSDRVTGDKYAGEWPREPFRIRGVAYLLSEKTRSEIYQAFLVLANSGRVEIPLHRRLITQLQRLERRLSRSGRETIDHSPGSHDDVANAAAGALVLAADKLQRREPTIQIIRIPFANRGAIGGGPDRGWRKLGG